MSEKNPIRLFVSHLFEEDANYLRVFEFLESVDQFYYVNVSKPENKPRSGGSDAVKTEIIAQIKAAEVVVVLASHFAEKPQVVLFHLKVANAAGKPVIVIRPFGGVVKTAKELVKRVKVHVDWNPRDIVDALNGQARGEATSRWEVIDFN